MQINNFNTYFMSCETKNTYFIVYMYVYHMCTVPDEAERVVDPLELKLQL